MKKRKTNLLNKVIMLLLVVSLCLQTGRVNAAGARRPDVKYSLHIQDKGWLNYVKNGATAGTVGKSLRAEAIKVQIDGMSGGITYRTHIQDDGWTSWSSDDKQSGSTGRHLRMEAIEMKLTGEIAESYDVYYRVHITYAGWLGWAKNGTLAGSTNCGIQMEAIQIKLSPKERPLHTSQSSVRKPDIKVKAHVKDLGWLNTVGDGETAGTTGKGYRMEGLQIECQDLVRGNGIKYRAHIEDDGWQGWKSSGQTAGTTGRSKRMEAVEIKLDRALEGTFDVYYRVHCADYGWLGWACNGESAGTTGGSRQMEAIQIKLIPKNEKMDKGGKAFYDLSGTASTGNTTNSQAQALVNMAKSQIGVQERSAGSDDIKYNDWFYGRRVSNSSGFYPWCAAFVSWCANETGILNTIIPNTANTTAMKNGLISRGGVQHLKNSGYTPVCGDIIFFGSNASQHVGIVEYTSGNVVYYIDGNNTSRVPHFVNNSRCTLNAGNLWGFVTPAYQK